MNLDCAKCGACTAVCPVYQVTGRESLTARGKLHLLSRLDPAAASSSYAGILSQCLLCGACRHICPQRIDTPAHLVTARGALKLLTGHHFWQGFLARQVLGRPLLLQTVAALGARSGRLLRRLPPDSGLQLRLGLFAERISITGDNRLLEENLQRRAEAPSVSYFTGCLAAHLEPGIARATAGLTLKATGAEPAIPAEQCCCGQAAYSCGDFEQARGLARRNISAFAHHGLPVLTSCASCYRHLLRYPDLLADEPVWAERARDFAGRLLEFSSFFNKTATVPTGAGRILYHDPCHLRFEINITAAPRQLLKRAGFDIVELPDGPRCCGLGGLFHLAHPKLSARLRGRMLADFLPLAVDLVTTTCSGCLLQWRQGLTTAGSPVPVRHLAEALCGFLDRKQ